MESGRLGNWGQTLRTKFRTCKYLKKCGLVSEYFSDSCSNDAKTLSIYKSLKFLMPSLNKDEKTLSITEGGKTVLAAIGASKENDCRPKCLLN